MALSRRNRSVVCLAALVVVVMATVMLSCDAESDFCPDAIGDKCTESARKDLCAKSGFTKTFCMKEGNRCCCEMGSNPAEVDGLLH